jgi:hypothetical protein
MHTLRTVFFTTLMVFGSTLAAQDTPEAVVEEFFEIYQEQSISNALEFFFPDNRWTRNIAEDLQGLKKKCENFFSEDYSGKYYGYEVIESQDMGNHYRKITCLVRFDRQPFRFVFVLYRPNDRWKGQNFFFSDKVEGE